MTRLKEKMLLHIKELELEYQYACHCFHYYEIHNDLEGVSKTQYELDDLEKQLKEAENYIKTL